MAVDLNALLAPVSDENPAGEDLTYDDERSEIEAAFERSVAIDSSGRETAPSDVKWLRIIGLIERQSLRTKDIWLPVYFCRAAARAGDLNLVSIGANYLAGLCEQYWDAMYPNFEEFGFQGRKGPCESLTSLSEFIAPLLGLPLLNHKKLGAFSGKDFDRFRSEQDAAENYGLFRMVLDETTDETLTGIGSTLEAIAAALNRVDAVLMARAESDGGVNFRPTYDALSQMKRAVLSFAAVPVPDEEPVEADEAARPALKSEGGFTAGGRIESRDDVVRALDSISDYYRRREPTSPIPLLLERARDWISLDFLEVLNDIAPAGVDEARRILTSRPKS